MSLSTLRFSTFNVASQVFYQSQSRLSFALVNLKPIVPGRELSFAALGSVPLWPEWGSHGQITRRRRPADDSTTRADVLVVPRRVVPRLRDLTPDEVTDLFASVHQISRVIEVEYKAQCVSDSMHLLDRASTRSDLDPPSSRALNIALQDGPMAGQSVPRKWRCSFVVVFPPSLTSPIPQTCTYTSSLEERKTLSH